MPKHSDRALRAARSDLLWELGVGGSMRHFGLSHQQVRRAMRLAEETRPPKRILAAKRRRDMRRLRDKLVRAEDRSHGVLHDLLTSGLADVGEHHGFTRQRACQIRQQIRELSNGVGKSEATIVSAIESEVAKATA